jgi:dihydrofolate reductase
MKISIIVAVSANNVIGAQGKIPWDIPQDMKHFKSKTVGHHVLMGRATQQSIGKPLKDRTNLVLSRDTEYRPEGYVVFDNLHAAIDYARNNGEQELMIIGGEQIYALALPIAETIYMTLIKKEYEGDTHFPKLDDSWTVNSKEPHEGNPDYEFRRYERRV